jgi:hypothetical protein
LAESKLAAWFMRQIGLLSGLEAFERFKKYRGRLERGFLGFGEALAKEHARSGL